MSGRLDLMDLARALDGDREALERCLGADSDGALARRHRIAAALALEALERDLEGPALDPWRSRLRQVSAHHMMLDEALETTGRTLGEAGIRWLPIKGLDLASRPGVYRRAEQRPTSDIDLLIAARDLGAARRALEAGGWRPLQEGPRAERYLLEEGYAWQARLPRSVLIEVHFRLWGSVAEEASDALVGRAVADPELPSGGHRLTAADAFLLAATHLWLDPPPRRLGSLRDLTALGRGPGRESLAREVLEASREADLQLPVLAAARAAHRLWPADACREAAQGLEGELRRSERRWLARQRDLFSAGHGEMTLARHLARRRTRHGLGRIVWRRLWAHPGIVEAATEPGAPWLRRRAEFQARAWGFGTADRRTEGP